MSIVMWSADAIIAPVRMPNCADRQAGIIVHAVDFARCAKRLIRPSLTMASPPAPPSSAGWKITTAVPAKLRVSGEIFGGAEQHRGVAVMAAGVHLARHRRLVGQPGLFLERQRVHVGAQADHLVARPCGRG